MARELNIMVNTALIAKFVATSIANQGSNLATNRIFRSTAVPVAATALAREATTAGAPSDGVHVRSSNGFVDGGGHDGHR